MLQKEKMILETLTYTILIKINKVKMYNNNKVI